ncbi:MAG TPA: bifunctional hydroxymethylpyrimidine kinase/phosphomethylpyrimidine kinase, partial [Candidatus Aquilonibacter sp.]
MGPVTVLSIGTTHPWNIAGVGLDIRIGAELDMGVFAVVCAVSAQDARGVHALEILAPATIAAQLQAIPWEAVRAVRIGALGAPEVVSVVATALSRRDVPVVVDPVYAASDGGALAGERTLEVIAQTLGTMPQTILTPNLGEASALLGRQLGRDDLATAAIALRDRGARAVLLKGGHLDGEPADALADADGVEIFVGERVAGEMRGTGCTLAMALACALARGDALRDAVRFARGFVHDKLVKNAR